MTVHCPPTELCFYCRTLSATALGHIQTIYMMNTVVLIIMEKHPFGRSHQWFTGALRYTECPACLFHMDLVTFHAHTQAVFT